MTRKLWLIPLFQLLCFGPHLFKTGFYSDDYVMLDHTMTAEGNASITKGMRTYAKSGYWNRPLEILTYPLEVKIGGMTPWKYRVIGLFVEMLTGIFLALLLFRLTGNENLALLAAALAMTFPNHSATHIWMTCSPSRISMLLVVLGCLLHVRGRVWVGQFVYALSMLEYEAFAFLPLALLVSPKMRKGIQPFIFTFIVVTCYQRFVGSGKPIALSLDHVLNVYWEGIKCVLLALR